MILCCGEALIDFLPAGYGQEIGYMPRCGGSPFNVALALSRLGMNAGFLGRISTDMFGDLLMAKLTDNNIDDSFVSRGPEPSTLAFVSLAGMQGQAKYAFYYNGAADRMLTPPFLPRELPSDIEALHFGSYSLVVEPSGATLLSLMQRERGQRLISLDPNVRPSMFSDRAAYVRRMEQAVAAAHLVKVSRRDLLWLYPDQPCEQIVQRWLALGATLVILTLAEQGSVGYYPDGRHVKVAAEPVRVVDAVGAGDSYIAAFLSCLQRNGALSADGLAALTDKQLESFMHLASKAAAIACSRGNANDQNTAALG